MNLKHEQKKVQTAMDAALSGLQEDPWLAQRVLANTRGEEPIMKKKISALVLVIILILAMIGTACAVFPSQISKVFRDFWNWDEGERLKEGKIAQIGRSVTAGGVEFTVEEIAYKDRALYGVVTIRAADEKDAIVPIDTVWEMQNEEGPINPDKWPKGARAVEKVKATGGRLLTSEMYVNRIGVDDGVMLDTGSESKFQWRYDGSITEMFMITDGFVVEEGTSYQIEITFIGYEVGENWERPDEEEDYHYEKRTFSCVPVQMETDSTPLPLPAELQKFEVPAEELIRKGYEVITPAAYQETGTLPVCEAVRTDMRKTADPAWFNTSGILKETKDGEDVYYTFNDRAELCLYENHLFYYDQENPVHGNTTDTDAIVSCAFSHDAEKYDELYAGLYTLEQEALPGITLEEARGKAEELFARMGMDSNQYTCTYALDMSMDRIRKLGAAEKAAYERNKAYMTVYPEYELYDYDAIPETKEGYYLEYMPAEIDAGGGSENYGAALYVTRSGIAYVTILNVFSKGETVYTPEKLISAEDAVRRLTEEVKGLRNEAARDVGTVRKVILNYEALRTDNKTGKMAFVPVWTVVYDEPGFPGWTVAYGDPEEYQDYDGYTPSYALFNAADGSLINSGLYSEDFPFII